MCCTMIRDFGEREFRRKYKYKRINKCRNDRKIWICSCETVVITEAASNGFAGL